MEEVTNQNTQYLRTHQAIVHAFIRLMKKTSFEKMTVQDILDETPVTRATFYRHFKDKYEVAEFLFEEYKKTEQDLIETMKYHEKEAYGEIIQSALQQKRDEIETLSKIHTDTVDFSGYLQKRYEENYLRETEKTYAPIEARIYASAMTAFQFSIIQFQHLSIPSDIRDEVIIPVFLKILELDKDNDTLKYLKSKCKNRPYRAKKRNNRS